MKFETYPVILFNAHPFHSRPFSIFLVSVYLLHGVQTAKSCIGILRDPRSPSGIFPFICLPTLYKVLDEVSTFLNSSFLQSWGQGQYQP